ncbi:MAG: hypothetical protein ACR2NW_06370 [Thermodesulfobacteriota bacterium]
MVNTERFEIKGKTPVSRTTIHGWRSVLFGLPFAAAGVFIILISFNIIPTPDNKFHVPRYMVARIGGLFLMAGLFLEIHGLLTLNYKSKKELINTSVWNNDYNWDPREITDRSRSDLIKFFFSTIFLIIFLIPFHLFIFKFLEESKITYFPKVLIGIFDLAVLIIVGTYFYNFLRYLKYGSSSLRFNQFPYFLGNNLDVTFIMSKPIKGADEIKATLQCIEEKYEIRGSGDNRKSVVVSYHIYSDTLKLTNYSVGNYGPLQIPIKFDLPEGDQYRTELTNRPPRYWELELKAVTPGIDFIKTFLVPVY